MRHSVRWRGHGDIDSVAIVPTGIAFAIETKTRRYDHGHLAGVREQAVWLSCRRRRWCRNGAVPALCVVRARGERRWEDGVLILSVDRLARSLEMAATADGSDSASTLEA